MDIKAVSQLLQQRGILLTFKWGMMGRFYEGKYHETKFRFRRISSMYRTFQGVKLEFFYSRPIRLGLFCGVNLIPHRASGEYKPLLSRKIHSPIVPMKCWAYKKEIAKRIVEDSSIQNLLVEIFQILGLSEKSQNGFMKIFSSSNYFILNDNGIEIFVSEDSQDTSVDILALFERISEVVQNLQKLFLTNGEAVYEENYFEKVFKNFLILLLIIIFIIIGFSLFLTIKKIP